MTISPPAVLLGSQRPTYRHVPPRATTAGPEAVELAASASLFLDPWQRHVLEDALGERADRKWAASSVVLVVPRQNGKGSVLEAKALHSLFLSDSRLILWSAQDFKTAAEGFLRVKSLIDNTDDLRRRVDKVRTSHGEEGIELRNGKRLRFVARSRSSGRGFSPDDVIMDEAYALKPEALAALLPTMSARPNPQVWYTSSAPLPDSEVLRRLCLRGRAGESDQMVYLEWCAEASMDVRSPEAAARANPGLGIRLTLDFTRSEMETLSEEEYARERLGIWRETDAASVIPVDWWADLADPDSTIEGEPTFALEVNGARTVAAIAAAGVRPDGLPGIEVIEHRSGLGWVEARVAELVERWCPTKPVVIDERGAAATFIEPLRRAGVNVATPAAKDTAAAAGRFFDACTPQVKGLRYRPHPALDTAVHSATTRPLGDAWTWDRRRPSADITPLVAATLALWGYDRREPEAGAPNLW